MTPWYEYSARGDGQPLPLAEVRLRHQDREVRVLAQVDSGADYSLFDIRYADALGLDRDTATIGQAVGAGGLTLPTFHWPRAPLEIQFEAERFPFRGSFAVFPLGSDLLDLVGRRDVFARFIVQFCDAAELDEHRPLAGLPPPVALRLTEAWPRTLVREALGEHVFTSLLAN